MSKPKPNPVAANVGPVTVAIPNTVESKMRSIEALSQAVLALSRALSSTNVEVKIQDCNIVGAKHTGIAIGQ